MENHFIKSTHNLFLLSLKILFSIKWMHIFCFLFSAVILIIFLPINHFVLKFSLQEIKIFCLNTIIIFSFLIPFGFLPITINSFKANYIYKIKRIPNSKNFHLFSCMIFLFFIYYLVVIIFMLILMIIIGIFLKDDHLQVSLLDVLFKSSSYNNSIFGNGINVANFLISIFVAFFFCAGIGWFFATFFVKKDYFLIILLFYFISIIISPFLLPIRLSYMSIISKIIYYFSIFYYPGNLMLLAWTGKNIFSISSVFPDDGTIFLSSEQIIVFYVISYCGLLIFISTLLLNTYANNFVNNIINLFSFKKFRNNFLNDVMNCTTNVAIISKSSNEITKLKTLLARYSYNYQQTIFIDLNIENFLPEFSFLENMKIFKSFTDCDYDKNFIEEMTSVLDLKGKIKKPISKLSKKDIMLLNFIFAILLNANKIIIVNQFRNNDIKGLKEFLKIIYDYTLKYNIQLVILTKEETNIELVCETFILVKSSKNIKWMNKPEWLISKK